VSTDWETKDIDCTDLFSDYCYMHVVLDDPSDGWLEISGVGWFQNSAHVWLPVCSTISYRVWDADKKNVIAGWLDMHIDCSDLVYP
jgi:hypothetical protein